MTRRELVAYAAGFIDGEGCIVILRKKNNQGVGFHSRYYLLRLQACNTAPEGIELLYGLFGGAMRERAAHSANRYNKGVMYEWETSSNGALKALKELLPHLRVKRAQAEFAIQFQNYRNLQNENRAGKRYGRYALSEKVVEKYDELHRKLQAMHCRTNRHSVRAETNSDSPSVTGSDSPNSEELVNSESVAETTTPVH